MKAGEDRSELLFSEVADRAEWTSQLEATAMGSLYNSWSWGDYKATQGWQVVRLLGRDDGGKAKAACQLQIKRVGPCRVLLLQGGLRCAGLRDEQLAAAFEALVHDKLQVSPFDIVLVNYHDHSDPVCIRGLLRAGLRPHVNGRMYSFFFDCDAPPATLEGRLSSNWRHNLKRALKNAELKVCWCETDSERGAALDAFQRMYASLTQRKAFAQAVDVAAMKDIIVADRNFHIASAEAAGAAVAIRIGYRSGDCIVDFLAASNELAIKNYANYLLVWSMIVKASEAGLRGFECGGIDPYGNSGVYNFKKGLGATLTMNGPLWIYAKSRLLGTLALLALAWST
ncbi:MAG TPA: GNAT family N-acetyltransferase [Candidatus Acidoferrum sp.]|nr:GNAT family N-acetyltransferase [Candidatus Acidoferrum sp.]